jgi:hypothetical protein
MKLNAKNPKIYCIHVPTRGYMRTTGTYYGFTPEPEKAYFYSRKGALTLVAKMCGLKSYEVHAFKVNTDVHEVEVVSYE